MPGAGAGGGGPAPSHHPDPFRCSLAGPAPRVYGSRKAAWKTASSCTSRKTPLEVLDGVSVLCEPVPACPLLASIQLDVDDHASECKVRSRHTVGESVRIRKLHPRVPNNLNGSGLIHLFGVFTGVVRQI